MVRKITQSLLPIIMVVITYTIGVGQAFNSPFTARGVGDIQSMALAHNQGYGGLGISNGNYWNLNNINPALLPYNTLTVFSAGFVGGKNNLTNGIQNESYTGGNLNYLLTAFPIKPGKWSSSLGLMPYSDVNYSFTYTEQVAGSNDVTNITESGSGGFNQVYWSNGFALNKNIFVGARIAYLFSSIETDFSNTIQNIGSTYTPIVNERLSVSDFLFTGGVMYAFDSIFKSKYTVKVGMTYEMGGDVNAKRLQIFERTIGGQQPLDADTISNQSGNITLPHALGLGISINRGIKWILGMDVTYRPWSEYRDFLGENKGYDDSYKITLGGEFTPDPTSVSSYFKRITFRLGGTYEQTPYIVENDGEINKVNDLGINFGWSLPAGRYSSFDMSFRFGKRGDFSKTILEENYYRIYLGITFNDQWFIKRKYD